MIDTRHDTFVDGCHNHGSEIACISRRTDLVEYHAQFRFLFAQTYHRLNKVVAESAIQPSRTYDHCILAKLTHTQCTGQFGRTIYTVGARRIRLNIWCMFRSVENVIGGNLYQPSAALLDGGSQISRRLCVQKRTQLFVGFSLVHCRISGTVDNTVYIVSIHEITDSQLIRNVQFGHVRIKKSMLGILFFQQLHLVTQLSVTTCNKYIHNITYFKNYLSDLNSSPFLSLK